MSENLQYIWLEEERLLLSDFISLARARRETEQLEWKKEIFSFVDYWFGDEALCSVHTSGSTGIPKKLEFEKWQFKYSAKQTIKYFGLRKNSIALLSLPVKYIAGKLMLARVFESGMNLLIQEPAVNPVKGLKHEIDFAALTPHQLTTALANPGDLDCIKTMIIGGEAVSDYLLSKLQSLKTKCYSTYGMTETLTHVAVKSLNHPRENFFRAFEGVHLSIDDRACLIIDAPYLKQEVVTNDMVKLLSDNRFRWLGRVDHVINTGGIKIVPEKVERKIELLLEENLIICGLPDDLLGKRVILVLEKDSFSGNDEELLKQKLETVLEVYERPKRIHFLPRFVYTSNGKINRSQTINLLMNK